MSNSLITYKFRIKDSNKTKALSNLARECNFVWNHCNEIARKRWKESRLYTGKVILNKLVKGASKELNINQQTVQAVAYELELRMKKAKKLIRFRGKKSLGWIPFNGQTIKAVGDRIFYNKSDFKFWHSRKIDGKIKTGSFNQDSRGRWYVNFVIEKNDENIGCLSGEVGIDLGLKTTASDSNGKKISVGQYRKLEKKLGMSQRANKKKQTKKIHAQIKNKRRDAIEKYTLDLAQNNKLIVIGNVSSQKIIKTKLAKSVLDNSWALLKNRLSHKTIRYGGIFLEVDEAKTSRTCSHCGIYWEDFPKGLKSLAVREYKCSSCEVVQDRDINAARNILRIGRDSLPGFSVTAKILQEESPTIIAQAI
jgi:putative transposase